MRILINLPSNNAKNCHRFKKSWDNLEMGDDWDVELIVNGPTRKSLDGFPTFGYEVQHMVNPEGVSMVDLRMDSVWRAMCGEFDYVCFMDDDLQFPPSARAWLLQMKKILEDYDPDVLSTFGDKRAAILEVNPKQCIMTTNRGLFLRVESLNGIMSETQRNLLGGGEEAVFGYYALEVRHEHLALGGSPITRGDKKHFRRNHISFIHDKDIYDGNVRNYIRERYNDPDWDFISGKTPKGLL